MIIKKNYMKWSLMELQVATPFFESIGAKI